MLAALGPDDRDTVEYYLRMPTEKALAMPGKGDGTYLDFAARSIDEVRQRALARCQAASRTACNLVAESETLLTTPPDLPARNSGR